MDTVFCVFQLIFLFLIIGEVSNNELPVVKSDICTIKQCIPKCCPDDSKVPNRGRKCQPSNDTVITLPVYNEDRKDSGKTFVEAFHLDSRNPMFSNHVFRKKSVKVTQNNFNIFLTVSGKLYLEMPNAYARWTPVPLGSYCLDYHEIVREDNSTYTSIGIWVNFGDGDDESETQGNGYLTTGMIISCVFLVLVLMVYSALPQLRNLGGMVLMAYTVSLLFAFIFLMVVQRGGHSPIGCVGLTLTVYFCFLASFCWMNTMSYDIWWTFRGYAKARPIHRRGETFKFCMYCLYAWGVPGAMTIALTVLNYSDMTHIPWFITPNIPGKGCFLESGEKLVYLYVPMLILIVLNWMFFFMTAFNIWRLSRGTAVLDSAAAGNPASHRKQRNRFLVYLKLSILMGLNWVLEVASSFKPELKIWYITDAYNLLIGLSIFLIFVCKKKIFKMLKKRFHPAMNWKPSHRSTSRSSSVTETSNISQDNNLIAIQINPNPKPLF